MMSRTRSIHVFLLLSALFSAGAAADTAVFLTADADAYADPVAIKAFVTGWGGKLHGGDTAFADANVESGVRFQSSSLAYVWRYDYELRFTPDTAAVYYQYKNRLPPTQEAAQTLFISAHHVEMQGIKLAHDFRVGDSWRLNAGLNLLHGIELTEGSLDGSAVFSGPAISTRDIASLTADIDYQYSKPALHEQELGWHPARPTGQGYSIDIDLQGDVAPHLHASLNLRNLPGYMDWKDVPATRYDLSCRCSIPQYDATGQLQIDSHHRQRLPPQAHARLRYDLGPHWYAVGQLLHNPVASLVAAGAGFERAGWRRELLAEPQTRSLIAQTGVAWGGLRLQSDRLDFAQARRLGISLYGQYAW